MRTVWQRPMSSAICAFCKISLSFLRILSPFFSGDIVRFFAQRVRFFGTSAPISNSTGRSLALPAFCEGIPRFASEWRKNKVSPLWGSCAASSKCPCKQIFLPCRYFAPLERVRRRDRGRRSKRADGGVVMHARRHRIPCDSPQKFKNFYGNPVKGAVTKWLRDCSLLFDNPPLLPPYTGFPQKDAVFLWDIRKGARDGELRAALISPLFSFCLSVKNRLKRRSVCGSWLQKNRQAGLSVFLFRNVVT